MVLAALCEQYLPSHRGLARDHQSLAAANDRHLWQQHHYQHSEREHRTEDDNDKGDYRRNSILDLSQPEHENESKSLPNGGMPLAVAATRRKKNRCKASKLLASCAADFDVLTDWLFYAHCRHENVEHFKDEGTYKIPPWMTGMVLASCLIGTSLWLVLATDGAIATPIMRFFGYDKLSLGHILLACVVLEDLPQVVLTFFIEDYFEEDQEFNNYAVVNVVASLYDILIKLAEAYDQRADIVETGHWCKDSIPAHSDKVLCLVPIPEDSDEEYSGGESVDVASVSNRESSLNSNMDSSFRSNRDSSSTSFRLPQDPEGTWNGGSSSSLFRNKLHVSNQGQHGQRRRRTLLQEAQEMVADTRLPPMRFLSASKEGPVKLWDTSINESGENQSRVPSEIFEGHGKRVSCISFVRKVGIRESDGFGVEPTSVRDMLENDETKPLDSKEKTKRSYFFLTGSYDGTCKLWKTCETQCIKTYKTPPFGNESALEMEVTSIAYIDCTDEGYIHAPLTSYVSPQPLSSARTSFARSEYFVNGYKSGRVRLWDLWSGACLKIFEQKANPKVFFRAYRKKKSRIYSLCSMEDGMHFVAGSLDGSIKMWELGVDDHEDGLAIAPIVEVDTDKTDQTGSSKAESTSRTITIRTTATPSQVFNGHTATVFSIQCVSPGSVLVSGSEDKTARLWSVSTGACLRTFVGHTGPIYDVAIVDQVTFLTASGDKTIRAWDVVSGDAFRTYENSSAGVTAVVTGDQSGCFLSGDENGNVGLWIFSAVHDEHHRASLLGIDDDVDLTMCGGCQGDVEMVSEEIDAAQGYRRIT